MATMQQATAVRARLRRKVRRDAVSVIGVWSIAFLFTVLTLTFALATEWWVMFFFGGNAAGAWMAVYKVERTTPHPPLVTEGQ